MKWKFLKIYSKILIYQHILSWLYIGKLTLKIYWVSHDISHHSIWKLCILSLMNFGKIHYVGCQYQSLTSYSLDILMEKMLNYSQFSFCCAVLYHFLLVLWTCLAWGYDVKEVNKWHILTSFMNIHHL